MIDYVLRFDSLKTEFNELMRRYDLPLSLNRSDNRRTRQHPFNTSDLLPETIQLIQKAYQADFDLLGFDY